MLQHIAGVTPIVVASSVQAQEILDSEIIHAVVTDILRRNGDGSLSSDDGYSFFRGYIRKRDDLAALPVIFHTKNLPGSFQPDEYAQYLSKWESSAKKEIELEARLGASVKLYEAYADKTAWTRILPRLEEINSSLLAELKHTDEILSLTPDQFEQLVAELLSKIGFSVRWVPGGKDQGVDIVASGVTDDFLIDVKRYHPEHPVTVELVRCIYGVAEGIKPDRVGRITHGGIITSSRFTRDAYEFQRSVRTRPLLKDGEWLKSEFSKYAPKLKG